MANENDEQRKTRQEFAELVNMAPKELEEWLTTDESRSVGQDEDGESTGHKSGRRIVGLMRTKVSEYSDDDYAHMREVRGYIKRHVAQQPSRDLETSRWRYSLMNWGHDPLR